MKASSAVSVEEGGDQRDNQSLHTKDHYDPDPYEASKILAFKKSLLLLIFLVISTLKPLPGSPAQYLFWGTV